MIIGVLMVFSSLVEVDAIALSVFCNLLRALLYSNLFLVTWNTVLGLLSIRGGFGCR